MNHIKSFSPLVMALAFFLTTLASCQSEEQVPRQPPPVRPVKTIVLEQNVHEHHRTFPGQVKADRAVDLAFRVSGPLIELPVSKGQQVKKGDLLARIDPRDFKNEVQNVQSALDAAQAQFEAMQQARPEDIKVLEAQVEAAEANFRAADKDFKRFSELYAAGSVSKSDFDKARQARDVAVAQLNTARQNLAKGQKGARIEDIAAQKAQIEGLKAQMQKTQNALTDTRLASPFDGIVAEKYVDNYQFVQAKQTIVKLQDLSTVNIEINLPERFVITATGTDEFTTRAVFDALPEKKFDLNFKEVATEPDPQTQTYAVTLTMPAPQGLTVLPGMTAQVTISWTEPGQGDHQIFKVPVEAVIGDETGTSFVWVVDPKTMTVHKEKVRIGEMLEDQIIILGGVTPGERIVVAGVHFLQEGQKIRLMDQKEDRS